MTPTPNPFTPNALPLELLQALTSAGLETRTDHISRSLYSTDASLYQIEPLGVAFPRTADHLNAAVELCAQYEVPIIARGSGSGLAGQAIGRGLILDCSRYLDQLSEINPEEHTASVQPGMILDIFNRAVGVHGLKFGPDPASSERATLGGIIGNNSTGAHSILYGMASDHILEVEVVLADGSTATFVEISLEDAARIAKPPPSTLPPQPSTLIYHAALDIRQNYAAAIRENWSKVWRRASGYSLNYLLPWSATAPPQWDGGWGTGEGNYPPIRPGYINLAPLYVGSEGTLGIVRKAKVNLVPKSRHTILGVLAYSSIAAACDDTPRLLELGPSAVELITRRIVHLARSVPAYAGLIDFVSASVQGDDIPAAFLVVEFAGDSPSDLKERVKVLGQDAYIAELPAAQARIWKVRKVGLGLLLAKPGNAQPSAFIEDVAVPVEKLGDYVRQIETICADQGIEAAYYAHASAGCLHIRPILDLRSARHIRAMRLIAEHAISAGLAMGGAVSGEHGDGLARSEWLEKAFGSQIMAAHRILKVAADPKNLLNPGIIINPPPMDANLRYGAAYHSQGWQPTLSFEHQVSLENAIEMCNGAGVCRKLDGFMCPSFQATREEMHSTRGRANLLREFIKGGGLRVEGGGGIHPQTLNPQPSTLNTHFTTHNPQPITLEDVYAALDLCLACKGCKTECPSGVDVAKLKYEFTQHYYSSHPRKLRDYVFGYFDVVAKLGARFSTLINWGMGNQVIWKMAAKALKLAEQRKFPKFNHLKSLDRLTNQNPGTFQPVLFLLDDFTQYNHPEAGEAALRVLATAGFAAQIIPVSGAGRTLVSKGFLEPAKKHARKLVDAIMAIDPEGQIPIVGVEPSEIFTLADEYPDFFPKDETVAAIAKRAWMIDEFLVRYGDKVISKLETGIGAPSPNDPVTPLPAVLLHGHCYQKARPPADDGLPSGFEATIALLEAVGYPLKVIDSGCCGMAGSFGYEAEHYKISMQVGELTLFPTIRQAGLDVIIAASGVSCQAQIEDGTQRVAAHPISLVAAAIGLKAK